jgi:hypothetical protein
MRTPALVAGVFMWRVAASTNPIDIDQYARS